MTTKERIERCERIGRKYFDQIAANTIQDIKSISYTELNEMHDVSVETATKSFMVEIKTRNVNHNDYDTNIIKMNKYQHLMEKMKEGYTPLYYNFYEDGKCLVWDLSKAKVVGKSIKKVRKTQMNSNSAMEDTMYYELRVADAKRFSYVV
jgi:hypothetical protein